MNVIEARDILVKGLYDFLCSDKSKQIPVYRSGQVNAVQKLPYIIYSVISDRENRQTLGHYSVSPLGEAAEEIRQEQVSATMSFTVCSEDRAEGEEYIYGEDEAQEIAEKCHGWFIHTGYAYFSSNNIVITDVTGIGNRNMLVMDVEANRKGFDVVFNYIAEDKRDIAVVNKTKIKQGGKR